MRIIYFIYLKEVFWFFFLFTFQVKEMENHVLVGEVGEAPNHGHHDDEVDHDDDEVMEVVEVEVEMMMKKDDNVHDDDDDDDEGDHGDADVVDIYHRLFRHVDCYHDDGYYYYRHDVHPFLTIQYPSPPLIFVLQH